MNNKPDFSYRYYGRQKSRPLANDKKSILDQALPLYDIPIDHLKENILYNPFDFFKDKFSHISLEIGFGKGEHLLDLAEKNPDKAFIGCEPYMNGYAYAICQAFEKGLNNIRFFRHNVLYLLDHLSDHMIDQIYILFPDPWPKTRHHKRRIIQESTLTLFHKKLKAAGHITIGTDHTNYLQSILHDFLTSKIYIWEDNSPAEMVVSSNHQPKTRYQEKAQNQKKKSYFIHFKSALTA